MQFLFKYDTVYVKLRKLSRQQSQTRSRSFQTFSIKKTRRIPVSSSKMSKIAYQAFFADVILKK